MQLHNHAFLALWNDTSIELDEEYNRWHSEEHVPERLTVPGMFRAYRYGNKLNTKYPYFTLYEMKDVSVLETEEYKKLLKYPTPWSKKMRLNFNNLKRVICLQYAHSSFSKMPKNMLVLEAEFQSLDEQSMFVEDLKNYVFEFYGLILFEDKNVSPLPWNKIEVIKDVNRLIVLLDGDSSYGVNVSNYLEQEKGFSKSNYFLLNEFLTQNTM